MAFYFIARTLYVQEHLLYLYDIHALKSCTHQRLELPFSHKLSSRYRARSSEVSGKRWIIALPHVSWGSAQRHGPC